MKVVIKKLVLILGGECHPENKGSFGFKVGQPRSKEKKGNNMLELSITNEQELDVTLKPKTATEKPAPLDGKPTWTKQSGEATFVESEDGLTATLISSDTPGVSTFVVEADAKIGPEFETISDIIQLTVNGAQAANLGLTASDPRPKRTV